MYYNRFQGPISVLACNLFPNSLECLLCLRTFTLQKTSQFKSLFWIGTYIGTYTVHMGMFFPRIVIAYASSRMRTCSPGPVLMNLMMFLRMVGPGRKCLSIGNCTSVYVRRIMSEEIYGVKLHISPSLSSCFTRAPGSTGVKARRHKSMSPSRASMESDPSST